MGKMVKSKKEYVCIHCKKSFIKWQGICTGCGRAGTLSENSLKTDALGAARKLRRRAKDSERNIAKRMTHIDGEDPQYSKIASSTGRVGHITGMRIDAVSKTYVIENKNRKIPTWMVQAWVLINQRSVTFNKNLLLHLEPPNMPKEFLVEGQKIKLDTLAVLTQTRHEDLIKTERVLKELEEKIFANDKYAELQDVFWRLKD